MYSLTIPQQNIWNLHKFYEGTSITNNCGAIFFDKLCDHELLNRAVNRLVALQEGMRLRFREEHGTPVQHVGAFEWEDFPSLRFDSMESFDAHADAFAKIPFAADGGKMYRFEIFDAGDRSGVLMCISHLIADAWAISIIAHTIAGGYEALTGGPEADERSCSFLPFLDAERDYLASERYRKDQVYWAEKHPARPEIASIRPGSLPTGKPAAQRFRTAFSPSLSAAIDRFYREHNITQAVLIETALTAYLGRISPDQRQITLGALTLNRSGAEQKRAVANCITTMPLTIPVAADMTAMDLCREITRQHVHLFRHQKYPYSHILHDLHKRFGFSGNLYDVMVSFQNARSNAGVATKWYSNGFCEVGLELHIDNRDSSDHYTVNIDYQTDLFPEESEVRLLFGRLEHLLEQIIAEPDRKLKELSLLPQAEQDLLVLGFNQTDVPYPSGKCIQEFFAEQVMAHPEKTALVFHDQRFTFRQLDEMSNSLAHELVARGIGPGSIVPIVSRRSWHIIVAMLGILKAGGAYMHVDVTYPSERIQYMFQIAKADFALTYQYFHPLACHTLDLEAFSFDSDPIPIPLTNQPEDLCYVIFTSGSTGKPKGLTICHRNAINFSHCNSFNVINKIIPDTEHSILAISSTSFDMSVTETLLPLIAGITIYFADDDQVISQQKLSEFFQAGQIDILETTPTKMRLYIADRNNLQYLDSIKAFILGGEALPADLHRELRTITNARIFNNYGPAETTVWSTIKEMTSEEITIGKPIANTQVYILDQNQQLLPIGVAGELCISGDGVGKGYLNRPDLTAARFLPDPFRPGQTMYRTGDLARWRMDGEIEYLGRIDTQVKIRGLRIELGEIESVMSTFPGIGLAAVTDKRDESGRQYLVGYYTSEHPINEAALRRHLTEKLPQYMVPNFLLRLDAMPMTASGKTDRKNLPTPDFSMQKRDFTPPETRTEILVAGLWEDLLGTGPIGMTDDFFSLGGDSLLAIHLSAQLDDTLGISTTVKDLMEHPELAQFSAFLDSSAKRAEQILPTNLAQYPLLPQQIAIYTACSKEPHSLAYNLPTRIKLPADVDQARLRECLLQLPLLHPELNTCIRLHDGIPTAFLDPSAALSIEDNADPSSFLRPFRLDQAPLVRFGFSRGHLLFDMHHIIADGTSISILLRDLAHLYAGQPVQPTRICYGDYAAYFQNLDLSPHTEYFRNHFHSDFEPVSLPQRHKATAGYGVSRFFRLDKKLFARARSAARQANLTDTMYFLGAYGILLSKFSGQEEILSSIVLTNRGRRDTESIVGMFVNTLPVSLNICGTAPEYLDQVRRHLLDLFEHQELPFLLAAEAAGMHDKTTVNTSFVYQAEGARSLKLGTHHLVPEWIETGASKFDLTFELTPDSNGCTLRIEYDSRKYDDGLIDRLYQGYVKILEQLPDKSPKDISVLSHQERKLLIHGFNRTETPYQQDKCIHELFCTQAARMPEKTALVFEGQEFTYRQLDKMSNSLAHFLREKGVSPGSIVPIIAKRSWHIIAAILGVLKAGGAYMPVDPSYPAERIQAMMEIAHCTLALTYGYDKPLGMETVALEDFDFFSDPHPAENRNSPDDLCYIIFTSGSTGTPKGVSICHRNVANYARASDSNTAVQFVAVEAKSIVSTTNIIFDIFVTESIMPLLNGITIYFANDRQSYSQKELAHLIQFCAVDVLQTTPTKMRSYMMDKDNLSYLQNLKAVILGGEALSADLFLELQHCSNAKILNIYGPAETTVWSTNKLVEYDDITIGKPIANTQVYILDQNQQLLPIGVAGELCISGDGVGKGYLNRPDLTAVRFLPDPFRPGQTMYRTGDLARWRMDGEIEYLGRIDTQVKIRGLRIELGEIESVMSTFPGIGLAAVTDKRDESGRQYLVGYYTSEHPINEAALRRHMTSKLPQYMVPNFLLHLDAMPMTASGKTDRKNLPLPELTIRAREYIAPETEHETILCSILEELLDTAPIGVTDDFFELGGDSLCAIEYVAQAHNHGIKIALQDVFDHPTARELCCFLSGEYVHKAVYDPADFVKYQPLLKHNVIDEIFVPVKKSLGNVLLTGATGFLGAHILDAYLKAEDGTVWCLVRGGTERLKGILNYYFGDTYTSQLGKRIRVLDGDITRLDLADSLPEDIQTVIHTAATVKHYGPWDYFHSVNVRGTEHVINYAKRVGAKLLHISTISVSGNSLVDAFDILRVEESIDFTEADLFVEQPLDNVYIRSKFEAERAVLDAALEGLDAKIIRVGNLTNRLSDFKFQPNYHSNAFLNRIRAALAMGTLPDYMIPLYAEFSPIDQTAEGIIKIGQYADQQTVFHLNSNQNLYFDRMAEILNELGSPMKILSGTDFGALLQRMGQNPDTAYIYEALQNDLDDTGKLVYDSNIHIRNAFTVWFMEQLSFQWAKIDLEYMRGYLNYFQELGYFPKVS